LLWFLHILSSLFTLISKQVTYKKLLFHAFLAFSYNICTNVKKRSPSFIAFYGLFPRNLSLKVYFSFLFLFSIDVILVVARNVRVQVVIINLGPLWWHHECNFMSDTEIFLDGKFVTCWSGLTDFRWCWLFSGMGGLN
jgi:hypothetical protein